MVKRGKKKVAKRDPTEKKAAGKCVCGDHDIPCKTMCGILLGPGAVDAAH